MVRIQESIHEHDGLHDMKQPPEQMIAVACRQVFWTIVGKHKQFSSTVCSLYSIARFLFVAVGPSFPNQMRSCSYLDCADQQSSISLLDTPETKLDFSLMPMKKVPEYEEGIRL
jgi:hypothetical protein